MDAQEQRKTGVIDELIRNYAESMKASKYSPETISIYRQFLGSFQGFLEKEGVLSLPEISGGHIERYRLFLLERKLQPTSVEMYLRAVKQFFAYLEEHQQIFVNPMTGQPSIYVPHKVIPAPSEEDVRKLLEQPDIETPKGVRDRAFLETAYSTGARIQELAQLRVGDVDLGHGTIRVQGKGSKERVLPLGGTATAWLTKYMGEARPAFLKGVERPALWIGSHGQELGYEAMQIMPQKYSRKAGLTMGVTTHALRRACATHMLKRGAHPVQIQMLLGHAALGHLGHYLRLTIGDLKAVHAQSNPGQ